MHTSPQSRRGLIARLRDRLAGRNERGDVLLEVIIFMGVIAIIAGAYTTSATSANKVAHDMTTIDVVDQQAQGVLEQAQVQPWELLGFNPNVQEFEDGIVEDSYGGEPMVTHNADISTNRKEIIQPFVELPTTRGVKMTQKVHITWEDNEAGTAAKAYGTKRVTVIINYDGPRGGDSGVKKYTTTRSSIAAEAVPTPLSTLPVAKDPNGDDTLVGQCPNVYFDRTVSPDKIRWDKVPGADGYHVARRLKNGTFVADIPFPPGTNPITGTSVNWGNISLTEDVYIGLVINGLGEVKVSPIIDGETLDCDWKKMTDWGTKLPQCPTGITFGPDPLTINWQPVPGAHRYSIERVTPSGPVTVAENITETSFRLSHRPVGSQFRVIAHNGFGASQCTTWSDPTPNGVQPSCPTNFTITRLSNQQRRFDWEPVAYATTYLVLQRPKGSGTSTLVATATDGAATATMNAIVLPPLDAYEYQVVAFGYGISPNCDWVSVETNGG